MLEYATDFPYGVVEHPVIERLIAGAVDMIWIGNDLYSWNVE
jgi:hypothetical protein